MIVVLLVGGLALAAWVCLRVGATGVAAFLALAGLAGALAGLHVL